MYGLDLKMKKYITKECGQPITSDTHAFSLSPHPSLLQSHISEQHSQHLNSTVTIILTFPQTINPNFSSFSISNKMCSATATTTPLFSTDHYIPKPFTRLCKPFLSTVPTCLTFNCSRPTFFVRATVVKWRCPNQTLPPNSNTSFEKKALYLESIGIDSFSLIENHPTLITASLDDIKSTVEYITGMDFSAIEFRRIVRMCPEILTTKVSDIIPVFTFLHREVCVSGTNIKHVINRRPRLIICDVDNQLRPTMYFLQSIGIEEVSKHTYLLSCSVQEKLIPRIEYFENIGFSRRDITSMLRRFPPLFCYGIKSNLEPKYNYFVVEMGRDLKELEEFPRYFSFSLENRIKPRHKRCVEMGVCLPLPLLLKTSEVQFQNILETFVNSSTPLKTSPLWCAGHDIDQV